MRNDLTDAFIAAIQSSSRTPLQVVVFHFTSGDVCLSDRDVTLHGVDYSGLVEDWGSLTTAGSGTEEITSETLQLTMSIWNGGITPFSNYFQVEDPVDVSVELFQTFEGLLEEDMAIIGDFIIQDPIVISEVSRLVTLDLVSTNMKYTAPVGKLLTRADWPYALEADINKGIDLIIGDAGTVQTLAARVPLTATLTGSFLKLPATIKVHEDLNELNWPSGSQYVVVDEETMLCSSRTANSFNIVTRGISGTVVTEHSDGATVLQYIGANHIYVIGQGPLASVSDIRVGGLPVDPSKYSVNLHSDPAVVVFKDQPSYVTYSRGARNEEVDLDAVWVGSATEWPPNTAFQPHYAYDEQYKSFGALLSKSFRDLSLMQLDPVEDKGELVKVFLRVEHWAAEQYSVDHVDVVIDGVGTVGTLSKPNPLDVASIKADLDLDHGHTHQTGGIHAHTSNDPSFASSAPQHAHPLSGEGSVDGVVETYRTFTTSYTNIQFGPNAPGFTRALLRFQITAYTYYSGGTQNYYSYVTIGGYSFICNTTSNFYDVWITTHPTFSVAIEFHIGGGTKSVELKFVSLTIMFAASATGNQSLPVYTNKSAAGVVYQATSDTNGRAIKDVSDVKPFAGANVPLTNITTFTPSRTVVERFDVTKLLASVDWSWFTNRRIRLTYVGSHDNVNIIITTVIFDVEYRQREIVPTTDVTAKPVGLISNRPDMVVQYLLNTVAGVPFSSMGSIGLNPEVWGDTDIWDDTDIWLDTGEAIVAPAGAYFVDAANRYSFLGYNLDGVLGASTSVKDAIRNICKQARGRFILSAGKVKLAVREKEHRWVPMKELTKSDLQLKSMAISKQEVAKIRNDISLFYNINRISDASGEGQYEASVAALDSSSIALHGQRKNNEDWQFDLVRDDAMAADLVDYYLWKLGEPATIYAFNTYLQQFDLEKEDAIRLSSDFFNLLKLPIKLLNNTRQFGSGKLKAINLVTLVGESIRHKFLNILLLDSISAVDDDFNISTGQDADLSGFVSVIDSIIIAEGTEFLDQIQITDSLSTVADFNNKLSDTGQINDSEIAVLYTLVLSESVNISDEVNVTSVKCFGRCGFGGSTTSGCTLPFGSHVPLQDITEDILSITDEIVVTLN